MTVYIGIDWSENKHDVVFLNEQGAVIIHFEMPHTAEGFLKLEKSRQRLDLEPSDCQVALETAHNMLIDFLWARSYHQVYVTPPSLIKSCRGRYGQSGARNDKQDGRLIADVLRTDRLRLQPWKPDSLLTRQMRAKISFISHLTRTIVRQSNRLRAVLLRYYPAGLNVFSSIRTQVSLHFLQKYNTPQAAAKLTWAEFEAFALKHGYPHPKRLPTCFARLQQTQPQASQETVMAYQDEVPLLATLLLNSIMAKNQALKELDNLFKKHPDQAIFASLPGAGRFLAPALLVKFGDDRQRFTSPDSVQALAGTCPITVASGKYKSIRFRRGCDREFRHIVQQWARHSLKNSIWANAYWQQSSTNRTSDNHAYRCLGNRWLAVAWKLWQNRQEYDEVYHLKQRMLHAKLPA